MKLLIKAAAIGTLTLASMSAQAYDCVLGGSGHCIWGFDIDNPERKDLIDHDLFKQFCDQNSILYCSAFNNSRNGIVGRYMNGEIFIITGKGWGGPDLIFDTKRQAEQFVKDFKTVVHHPDARFYVKNAPDEPHPAPRIVSVAYKAKTAAGNEKIKLWFLPNEHNETGDNHEHIPSDEFQMTDNR